MEEEGGRDEGNKGKRGGQWEEDAKDKLHITPGCLHDLKAS